jgi:hypothetical protein
MNGRVASGLLLHHFLEWQRALRTLPLGTEVHVVFGCGDRPKEPEAMFLDHAAADLWRSGRTGGLADYAVKYYRVHREEFCSELTLLVEGGGRKLNGFETVCAMAAFRRGGFDPLPADRGWNDDRRTEQLGLQERLASAA